MQNTDRRPSHAIQRGEVLFLCLSKFVRADWIRKVAALGSVLLMLFAFAAWAPRESPADAAEGAIPATFFSINTADAHERPNVKFGTLGHPTTLIWPFIEPSRGNYDFSLIDRFVEIAPKSADGTANIVLTLGTTPLWATRDRAGCSEMRRGVPGCPAPPDNIQDWKDFIIALIHHYDGQQAPHVKYYELWNEANRRNFFTGSPSDLVRLAAAAYPIIKEDSHSEVLTPSTVGDARSTDSEATHFMAEFLRKGGSDYADMGAFHGAVAAMRLQPYPLPTETCSDPLCWGDIVRLVNNYRRVLDENGMSGKPLFNTEGGFEMGEVSDPAAWLAQYFVLQASLYRSANLQMVSWFCWGCNPRLRALLQLGGEGRELNEAGFAYNQVHEWLVGATFLAPCSKSGSTWSCHITRPGGYEGLILWDSAQTCDSGRCRTKEFTVPATHVKYRELSGGTPASIKNRTVPLGLRPILVENQ